MPLEGISSSGSLIPAHQLAEAASLGAFEAKVEHSAPIKKPEQSKESEAEENDEEAEGDNAAAGYYNEKDDEKLTDKNEKLKIISSKVQKQVKYTIKFNKYTELVELVEINSGKVLQTIAPNDLIALISELKLTSGVFVDNQI